MKNLFLVCVFFLSAGSAFSQMLFDNPIYTKLWVYVGLIDKDNKPVIDAGLIDPGLFHCGLAPVLNNGKWGFTDLNNNLVIQFQFDSVKNFSDNAVFVFSKKKWGLLNNKGELISDFQYEKVRDFNDGFAVVSKDNKWNFLGKNGKLIGDNFYSDVVDFSEGMAAVKNEKDLWGIIDVSGKLVIPFKYLATDPELKYFFSESLALVQIDDDGAFWYGFINKKGKQVLSNYILANSFSEGLAWGEPIGNKKKENTFAGYIDSKGKELINTSEIESAIFYEFSNGMARVFSTSLKKWTYINREGKLISPFQFDEVNNFKNEIALVKKDGWFAYINKDAKLLTEWMNSPPAFSDGLFLRKSSGLEVWGFGDKSGNYISKERYISANPFFKGLACVSKTEGDVTKYGMVDKSDKLISGWCDDISKYNGEFFWVSKDHKFGMLNNKGECISGWFDLISRDNPSPSAPLALVAFQEYYSDGLMSVCRNKKWGFIDYHGKKIIDFQFDQVADFHKGFALVKNDKKWFSIDKSGKPGSQQFDFVLNPFYKITIASVNRKIGFIDGAGKIIIDPQYEAAADFGDSLSTIVVKDKKLIFIDKSGMQLPYKYYEKFTFSEGLSWIKIDTKYGCIDVNGKLVFDFMYEDALLFSEGLCALKNQGLWGFGDKTGIIKIPLKYESAESFNKGTALVKVKGKKEFYIDKSGKCVKGCN